jgi:hypothetical protein
MAHLNATGAIATVTPSSPTSSSVTKKLSGGAIAGIVLAILIFVGVIACAVCGVYIPHRRRQRVEKLKQNGFFNSNNNNMVLQDAKKSGGFYPFRRMTTKEKEGGAMRSNGNDDGNGGASKSWTNWIPSGATIFSLIGRNKQVRVGPPKRKQPSPLHQQPRQRIDLALDEDAELASPVSASTKGHAWNSNTGHKYGASPSRDNTLAVPGTGRSAGMMGAGTGMGTGTGGAVNGSGGVFLPTLVGGLPPSPRDRINTWGSMNDEAGTLLFIIISLYFDELITLCRSSYKPFHHTT